MLELSGLRSAIRAYMSQRRYGSMKQYIGCDAHARYSIFASLREDGGWDPLVGVEHNELEMERFLKELPRGSPVALESSGNWYWLVRAMEEAGLDPRLAHALEAKKRMPGRNKTDQLDAKGLAADVAQRLVARGLGSAGEPVGSAGPDANSAINATARQ
jgi:hypothetical protein